ncbi:uncharacterized protein LOC111020790 [Momordica charantia]|uniref:Uncharacterized protein LOC111020790 n=1 Tax=Momordica charantia TaxID=3673 RepID=A0A6J1DGZ9_MOMCH|nr:uncharacterized protein LOC111020790 [Momordica charantia]
MESNMKGIHLVCFNCGVYGHKLEECPLRCNTETKVNDNSSGILDSVGADSRVPKESNIPEFPQKPFIPVTVSQLNPSPGHGPWMLVDHSKRNGGGKPPRTRSGRGFISSKNLNTKWNLNSDPNEEPMNVLDTIVDPTMKRDPIKSFQIKSVERVRLARDQDSWRFKNKIPFAGPGANFSSLPFDYQGTLVIQDTDGRRKPRWMDQDYDPGDMDSEQEDDTDPKSPIPRNGYFDSAGPQQVRLCIGRVFLIRTR